MMKSLWLLCMLLAFTGCKTAEEESGQKEEEQKEEEPAVATISGQIASFDDDIVATDALGRVLPTYKEAGSIKGNHYVGLFYWLWHGNLRNNSSEESEYNVTLSNQKDPKRTDWQYADYYWAKPELGYYLSTDKYVMRKHLCLFCLMGIDFLYLDFTNTFAYSQELTNLIEIIEEFQAKGYNPPRLVPFFNAGIDGPDKDKPYSYMEKFYTEFVKGGKHPDVWFRYEGKPLILAPCQHDTDKSLNNAFTWRQMWAAFPTDVKDRWRFFDSYATEPVGPHPAYRNGVVEQMAISKGLGAPIWEVLTYGGGSSTTSYVPTYNEYFIDPENTGKGLYFEEQAQQAMRIQPPILCITGWNEWKAGAWPADESLANAKMKFRGEPVDVGTYYFVDEFNEEFNRDFEPQENPEYSDNFYYQLAGFIRKYKGMKEPQETSPAKTVDVSKGDFSVWNDVTPVYKDFEGDACNRTSSGAPKGTQYTNYTFRNDIVESRVTYDSENVYFYVKTANDLNDHSCSNWMLLYIDRDRDKSTGWEGYDYAVNMEVKSENRTVLKKRTESGWEQVAVCPYSYSGNQMHIAVPLEALGLSEKPAFYFHWMDNSQALDKISEFFVNGDSAPERRYNYAFNAE